MALTSRVSLELLATLTGSADFGAPSSRPRFSRQIDLTSGTGAGQADVIWTDQRTLAASASEDLDLAGSLTDVLGATVTLARVKVLYVAASSANSNNVVLGAAASNAWAGLLNATGTVTLRPGQVLLTAVTDATAMAVTAGTGDLLAVANSGAGSSVTYDIAVIGASA
ncbi:hypothetical protein [Actinomadura sediminis]|uniref:PLAT domain-containing protein n=1 Tax=Actinomadura sediminis TaxID=1038904 RepID=A0ABW3ES61_9ACTN